MQHHIYLYTISVPIFLFLLISAAGAVAEAYSASFTGNIMAVLVNQLIKLDLRQMSFLSHSTIFLVIFYSFVWDNM